MMALHLPRERERGVALLLRCMLAVVVLGALAACTQTKSFQAAAPVTSSGPPPEATVLLMPVDVEVSRLTASGLEEPNAEWTRQGRQNVIAAVQSSLRERRGTIVPYETQDDLSLVAPEHEQLFKLHEAVGSNIILHKYVPGGGLPTTSERFEWTLGRGARALKETYGADYALFVFARDSLSSSGRVALMFTAALFGVAVPGGRQDAFASLVDLDSGDIVWFNVLTSGVGDLREVDSAHRAVETLLSDAPL